MSEGNENRISYSHYFDVTPSISEYGSSFRVVLEPNNVKVDLASHVKALIEWLLFIQNEMKINNIWLSSNKNIIDHTIHSPIHTMNLSFEDCKVLKQLIDVARTGLDANAAIDFTNPSVIKAYETFLTVAKLASDQQK